MNIISKLDNFKKIVDNKGIKWINNKYFVVFNIILTAYIYGVYKKVNNENENYRSSLIKNQIYKEDEII